jgi:hypothetical protein
MSLDEVKRADIHIKLSKNADSTEREQLIDRLAGIGFYRVVTWAGNEVCTGQFTSRRVAHSAFTALSQFFDRCGGCSELTLELAPKLWRNSWLAENGRVYSAMPPIIRSDEPAAIERRS